MTEETKPMTVIEVQEMIIGSPEKMKLLNIFNTLMQENTALKKQLEEKNNAKT